MIGSGNAAEGELRPQLLDRFGLSVDVRTMADVADRATMVRDRLAYETNPTAFAAGCEAEQAELRGKLVAATAALKAVHMSPEVRLHISEMCSLLGIDGIRGDITVNRAARALVALEGREEVTTADVARVAGMCLNHRLRKDVLDEIDTGTKVALAWRRVRRRRDRGGGCPGGGGDGERRGEEGVCDIARPAPATARPRRTRLYTPKNAFYATTKTGRLAPPSGSRGRFLAAAAEKRGTSTSAPSLVKGAVLRTAGREAAWVQIPPRARDDFFLWRGGREESGRGGREEREGGGRRALAPAADRRRGRQHHHHTPPHTPTRPPPQNRGPEEGCDSFKRHAAPHTRRHPLALSLSPHPIFLFTRPCTARRPTARPP